MARRWQFADGQASHDPGRYGAASRSPLRQSTLSEAVTAPCSEGREAPFVRFASGHDAASALPGIVAVRQRSEFDHGTQGLQRVVDGCNSNGPT